MKICGYVINSSLMYPIICFFWFVFSLRRQYLPLSLFDIQRMIDLNRLDVSQPIDLATICNTGVHYISREM